jgi:hypothetical protein
MWTDGQYYLYGNTIIVDKGPTNVVFQFDGNSTRKIWNIYLNGKLDATRTLTISNANFPLLYANQTISSSGEEIKGNMYTYSVYDRVLSSSEILKNYQSMLPRFVGENIVTDGLVLYLDAGYKSSYSGSGTTWYDVSGNGYNFTLRNGVSAGTYNNITCFSFDGSDDNARWVDTGGFRQDIGTECTISIWMNGNGTSLGQQCCRLISFNSNVDINEDYTTYFCMAACNTIGYLPCYRGSTSGGVCAGAQGSNYQMYTTDFKLVTVSWSTITDKIDVYLNNTNIFNASLTAAPFNYSEIKRIALASNAGNLEYSNIRISSMQMYSKKLSVSELTQNYNAQKSRYGL